jgi:hypothetical protein
VPWKLPPNFPASLMETRRLWHVCTARSSRNTYRFENLCNIWRGTLGERWSVIVQIRLPGAPLNTLDRATSEELVSREGGPRAQSPDRRL